MPTINFNQNDFDFLVEQAALEEISVEDYVSLMVGRQRVIVKYPSKSTPADPKPSSTLEPPHRKWGM
jgi:hypothetical protein